MTTRNLNMERKLEMHVSFAIARTLAYARERNASANKIWMSSILTSANEIFKFYVFLLVRIFIITLVQSKICSI